MSAFTTRTLGKTGLKVHPLGIGCGTGISNEDLMYAFEQGINYFFYSSDLHHFSYSKSAQTLRQLCGRGSAVRDKVVLATVSYLDSPEKILGVLVDQFRELGVDYIDVFHWGWITDKSDTDALIKTARLLTQEQFSQNYRRNFLELREQADEINNELLKKGLVRHVGASFHSRQQAQTAIPKLDVLMLRYNLAHRGVENEVFPYLSGDKSQDPGIVVFNSAHEGNRYLNQPPSWYTKGFPVPTIPDCYRFALTNPAIDLVLTGPANRQEVDAGLAMLEKGPMSAEEYAAMQRYGNIFSATQRRR